MICAAWPADAVSTLNGIEPGTSTRAQAEKVFGVPTAQVSNVRSAYAPPGGTSGIEIEYTAEHIVARIDLSFAPGLARDVVIRGNNLPAEADARETKGSQLVEYFGGTRTFVITHAGDSSSPVERVSYCSRQLFDGLTAALNVSPSAPPTPSAAVELSNPNDKPSIVQFNPAACQDVYVWAQRENDVARRGRDAARRQAILEIMVTAQRGDCARARPLADAYKKTY